MGTEVPLPFPGPALLIFPALSAVLLVLGLLCALSAGSIAYARSLLVARHNGAADTRRLGAAAATAAGLSALLLFGGYYGLFAANLASLSANLSAVSFPRLEFYGWLLEAGNALWPPLLAVALGAYGGIAREQRGPRSKNGSAAGSVLADLFAFWLPRTAAQQAGHAAPNEPEFEITMASGEEVEQEERQYIENILEMGDTTALEVMRPRTDVVALDADWPQDKVVELVAASRHSRFPVYDGSIDNVIGVLHLRDLYEFVVAAEKSGNFNLRSLINDCFFVPASRKVDDALRDLQRQQGHLAVVLDEYGGTAGIITIEDLLEEIVGEIQDEHDDEAKQVHMQDDGSMIVSAQMPIDEFNALVNTAFEAEDVETLGGYIIHGLGRIPRAGEKYSESGVQFKVLSVGRNRVGRVRVEVSGLQPGAAMEQ